jgi:hypothetical protein
MEERGHCNYIYNVISTLFFILFILHGMYFLYVYQSACLEINLVLATSPPT